MKRILLVDDHEVVREGLKSICGKQGDPVQFGEAIDASEALKLAGTQAWDMAILDISLGSRSGLDILAELREIQPRMPVLVLSMHAEAQNARRAIKGGAAGYVTKDTSRLELAKAIEKILKGGRYVSSAMADWMMVDLGRDAHSLPVDTLSNRELEVMILIAKGKPLSEIASLLCLSAKTISTYRARILEKLQMKSTAELVRFAIENHVGD